MAEPNPTTRSLRIRIRPLSQTNHMGSGSLTLVQSHGTWEWKSTKRTFQTWKTIWNHRIFTKVENGWGEPLVLLKGVPFLKVVRKPLAWLGRHYAQESVREKTSVKTKKDTTSPQIQPFRGNLQSLQPHLKLIGEMKLKLRVLDLGLKFPVGH